MQFWFRIRQHLFYPAALRVGKALTRRHGVRWNGRLFSVQSSRPRLNDSPPFNLFPVQGAICGGIWAHLRDLELVLPADPVDSLQHSVLAADRRRFASEPYRFVRAVFRVSVRGTRYRPAEGKKLEQENGQPVGPAGSRTATSAIARRARRCCGHRTERAVALGIFGAPPSSSATELFWGNDRLKFTLAWQHGGV